MAQLCQPVVDSSLDLVAGLAGGALVGGGLAGGGTPTVPNVGPNADGMFVCRCAIRRPCIPGRGRGACRPHHKRMLCAARRFPGCERQFANAGALHTHQGWHRRKQRMKDGVYDKLGHRSKELHSIVDAEGRQKMVEVYRCDFPGCGKLFQQRGALHTHQGWHKRRPKSGANGKSAAPKVGQKRPPAEQVQLPRKRQEGPSSAFHAVGGSPPGLPPARKPQAQAPPASSG